MRSYSLLNFIRAISSIFCYLLNNINNNIKMCSDNGKVHYQYCKSLLESSLLSGCQNLQTDYFMSLKKSSPSNVNSLPLQISPVSAVVLDQWSGRSSAVKGMNQCIAYKGSINNNNKENWLFTLLSELVFKSQRLPRAEGRRCHYLCMRAFRPSGTLIFAASSISRSPSG